eukprot:jgi/Botrbrau1/8405/Bobra.0237s0026.1
MNKTQAKKELAEAGRRKLEAFRRQKAEGKSKKATPASQVPSKRSAAEPATPSGDPVPDEAASLPNTLRGTSQMGPPAGGARDDPNGRVIVAPVQDTPPRAANMAEPSGEELVDQESDAEPLSQRGQESDAEAAGSTDSTPPVLPVSRPPLMADSPPGSVSQDVAMGATGAWGGLETAAARVVAGADLPRQSWPKPPPPKVARSPEPIPRPPPLPSALPPLAHSASAHKLMPDQDELPVPVPPTPPPAHQPLPSGPPTQPRLQSPPPSSPVFRARGAYAALSDSYLGAPPTAARSRTPDAAREASQNSLRGPGSQTEVSAVDRWRGEAVSAVPSGSFPGARESPGRHLQKAGPSADPDDARRNLAAVLSSDLPVSVGPRVGLVQGAVEKSGDDQSAGDHPGTRTGDASVKPRGVLSASTSYAALSDSYLGLDKGGPTVAGQGDEQSRTKGITAWGASSAYGRASSHTEASSGPPSTGSLGDRGQGTGSITPETAGSSPRNPLFGDQRPQAVGISRPPFGASGALKTRVELFDRRGTGYGTGSGVPPSLGSSPASASYTALSDSYLAPAKLPLQDARPGLPGQDTAAPPLLMPSHGDVGVTRIPPGVPETVPQGTARDTDAANASGPASPGRGGGDSAPPPLLFPGAGGRAVGAPLPPRVPWGTARLSNGALAAPDHASAEPSSPEAGARGIRGSWGLPNSAPGRGAPDGGTGVGGTGNQDRRRDFPESRTVPKPESNGAVEPGDAGEEARGDPRSSSARVRLAQPPPKTGNANFSALQQYIDELTQEKFELLRALEVQRKLGETLASENQTLTEDFNRQGRQVVDARKEAERIRAEVAAQQLAVTAMAAERDACRTAVAETSERCKALAEEVVSLEERALHLRASELRLTKEAEELRELARRAGTRAESALLERDQLSSAVETLREQQKVLQDRLREHFTSADAVQSAVPVVPPAVQSTHAQPSGPSAQTDLRPPGQATTTAEPASVSSPPAGPSMDRTQGVAASADADQEVPEGPREAVSAGIAAAAMRQIHSNLPVGGASSVVGLPAALDALLPRSALAGGLAGAANGVVADSRTALSHIFEQLDELVAEKRGLLDALQAREEELAATRGAQADLQARLEATMQRLEIALQHNAFSAHVQRQAPPAWAPEVALPDSVRSAPPTPVRPPLRARRGAQRRSIFGWLVDVIAPPPEVQKMPARGFIM